MSGSRECRWADYVSEIDKPGVTASLEVKSQNCIY